MVKRTNDISNWLIFDTARGVSNEITAQALWANLTSAEGGTNEDIDLLSNGFKPRDASASFNINGSTYIFLAFAEHPFNSARAR
jgi:hypothetical protein